MVAAVLDKLWDDFKRLQLHEIYSGNAASQGSGTAWPPTSPVDYKGLSPDLPMRNVQTGKKGVRSTTPVFCVRKQGRIQSPAAGQWE